MYRVTVIRRTVNVERDIRVIEAASSDAARDIAEEIPVDELEFTFVSEGDPEYEYSVAPYEEEV